MTSKMMFEAQRRADAAHHKKRVQWLEGASPLWSCGSPVSMFDKKTLLRQSRDYLKDPSAHLNHCHCSPRCG